MALTALLAQIKFCELVPQCVFTRSTAFQATVRGPIATVTGTRWNATRAAAGIARRGFFGRVLILRGWERSYISYIAALLLVRAHGFV